VNNSEKQSKSLSLIWQTHRGMRRREHETFEFWIISVSLVFVFYFCKNNSQSIFGRRPPMEWVRVGESEMTPKKDEQWHMFVSLWHFLVSSSYVWHANSCLFYWFLSHTHTHTHDPSHCCVYVSAGRWRPARATENIFTTHVELFHFTQTHNNNDRPERTSVRHFTPTPLPLP